MKKITKSTFKSFINKNEGKLFIQLVGDFNGMTDCVEYLPPNERIFKPLEWDSVDERDYQYSAEQGRTREEVEERFFSNKNTLGYKGIWLVNHSRDSFRAYEDENFIGINVYNCCGNFTVAIKKQN